VSPVVDASPSVVFPVTSSVEENTPVVPEMAPREDTVEKSEFVVIPPVVDALVKNAWLATERLVVEALVVDE
jgi:hypothetical protein